MKPRLVGSAVSQPERLGEHWETKTVDQESVESTRQKTSR